MSAVPNLTRDDARARAELLSIENYDIVLDLTDGGGKPADRTFRSTTTITFRAVRPGAGTFVDLIADTIHSVTLNGDPVDFGAYTPPSGIPRTGLAADNVRVAAADG